ncbi:hypothetical protein HPB47_027201 [Ixodes persulcatus]|uniref:Uncharacterized protein n=1 Tax=Ixodes persulcatus TaxID=34615 RepID=A0AC60PYZ6_IXOPE|nr:hypothetical protein HPB47_027201 [Ixodes persulcatus]
MPPKASLEPLTLSSAPLGLRSRWWTRDLHCLRRCQRHRTRTVYPKGNVAILTTTPRGIYRRELWAVFLAILVSPPRTWKINRLISVMASLFTAEALRPNLSSRAVIASFLEYLAAWQSHADGTGGFLSESTAVGLRVTLSSTLELLSYLTEEVGYKYIMTSRLSQDPIENLIEIEGARAGAGQSRRRVHPRDWPAPALAPSSRKWSGP